MYSLQQKLTMALVSSSIISLGGGGGIIMRQTHCKYNLLMLS